ncbi:MAG: hypothetical protein K5657_04275 [Desulfovibrio sp.]|nr:hypothetical protein [Desulfovibrio sp.]
MFSSTALKPLCWGLCILVLLFLSSCDEAPKKIYLYGDFYYGMSHREVQKMTNAVSCKDSFDNLCRPNPVPFFQKAWYQRFLFRQNRLYAVQMIHTEPNKVDKIINTWLDSGYRYLPVAILSGGKQLDLFAVMKRSTREVARKAVNDFTRMTAKDLQSKYIYLDLTGREDCLNAMDSLSTILRKAPRDIIGIEQTVNDKELIIGFTAPIAEWQDKGIPRAE